MAQCRRGTSYHTDINALVRVVRAVVQEHDDGNHRCDSIRDGHRDPVDHPPATNLGWLLLALPTILVIDIVEEGAKLGIDGIQGDPTHEWDREAGPGAHNHREVMKSEDAVHGRLVRRKKILTVTEEVQQVR